MEAEKWKDIDGYDDYQISTFGRVKSYKGKKERILKPGGSIYCIVILCKNNKYKCRSIHSLVAQAFIPNPLNLPQVNHISKSGDKRDNRVENLEWLSRSENVKHAFKTGLINQVGSNNNGSKLTNKKVLEIRRLYSLGGYTYKSLGEIYDVHKQTIANAITYKTWKHI